MKQPKVYPGSLLVAAPTMRDPNFARTVVFMIAHGQEGSFGLVINRPTGVEAEELIPSSPGQVYSGGPVQPEEVLILHRLGELVPAAHEIVPGVAFGGDLEDLKLAIEKSPVDRTLWRVYLGYSGWNAGQLRGELEMGGWVVCPGRAEYVFDLPAEKVWAQVLSDQGDEYRYLTTMPLDPSLN